MARVMVKGLVSALTLTVALSIGYGMVDGAPAPKSLTLAQSVSLAVSQSPQVRLATIAVTEAQREVDRISADQLMPGSRKGIQAAVDSVELAKMSLAATKDDVAAQVEQAYFAVLMANDIVKIRSLSLETAQKQLAAGKAKSKAGIAKQADVVAMEDSVASTKYSLLAAKYSQRLALLRFNKAMGWDLETQVALNGKLDYKPIKVDLKASLTYAMANRRDVVQATYAVQRRSEDLALANNEFTPVVEQERLKMELEKAEIALSQIKVDAIISVEESYANLINAQNEVDNRSRSLERAKQALSVADKKYKAGLIKATDLISAQTSCENAELQKLQAINDYRSAVSAFYRAIGQPHPYLSSK